jgi:hypothetical protein
MSEASQPAKPRKRQAVKTASRPASAKVKLTLYVSVETAQRLAVHATMTSQDKSSLVETLIKDGCRRYVVSDRARSEETAGEGSAA